jgi:hypothetical protein
MGKVSLSQMNVESLIELPRGSGRKSAGRSANARGDYGLVVDDQNALAQ